MRRPSCTPVPSSCPRYPSGPCRSSAFTACTRFWLAQLTGLFILLVLSCSCSYHMFHNMSHVMTKPTKWNVSPAKTQISLGIRPAWSESSMSAWRKLGSLATHWAEQLRLWSDWADAQADLSLRWAHSHFAGFVMSYIVLISAFLYIDKKSLIGLWCGDVLSGLFTCHKLQYCHEAFTLFAFSISQNNKDRRTGICSTTHRHCWPGMYCNDAKYLDWQVWANSVDPDQTAPSEQSDQGLHCLPFDLQYCMTGILQVQLVDTAWRVSTGKVGEISWKNNLR